MFGLFGKKKKQVSIAAPITGKAVALDQVPDAAFSQKIIGDGIAIEPTEGVFVAPFDGTIVHLIDSHHSLVMASDEGVELLVHIGINTVSLQGKPFTPHVKSGDKVKKGDTLIEFDIAQIKEAGLPTITPVIIANGDVVAELKALEGNVTAASSPVIEITLK